jgi:hypothetical protein
MFKYLQLAEKHSHFGRKVSISETTLNQELCAELKRALQFLNARSDNRNCKLN